MSAIPDLGAMGKRQQQAARLRAEMEARKQERLRTPACKLPRPENGDVNNDTECYRGAGPIGEGEYLVGQGECLSSIAAANGYLWETIWNDPANAALKLARKNPNALLPGDRVVLPAKMQSHGSGQTEMRHRFVRHGEPTWLVLKLLDGAGAPRPNLPYTIDIDGDRREGMTDGDGKLRERIPGKATLALLKIENEEKKEEYRLKLGHIDPAREVTGMQARLNNLGFACGRVDGKVGPRTRAALNRFRAAVGLPASNDPDEPTLARLEQHHDQMETLPRPEPHMAPDNLQEHEWVQQP